MSDGGRVTAESVSGPGAMATAERFAFTAGPSPADGDEGPDQIQIGALVGVSVLVVEDDPLSREALELILSYYGARVASAASVSAALSCYERHPPSVIVSDIGLPDDDGLVLMRTIRAREFGRGRRTPAIAISGFPSRETSEHARGAGFDAFLPKPIDVGALLRMVSSLTSPG